MTKTFRHGLAGGANPPLIRPLLSAGNFPDGTSHRSELEVAAFSAASGKGKDACFGPNFVKPENPFCRLWCYRK
jgi:hypothetical protein